MPKPIVLLTGASGSMGHEAFLELMRRADRYQTRLLLRPSKVNKAEFTRYESEPNVEIVWGDLTAREDVRRAVDGADFVLHPAAMISPAADHNPKAARRINVDGTRYIIEAIQDQPRGGDDVRFVYIGSVAQYGDRLPPYEWIRVGDPLKPSMHDYYALTKCEAETAVIESGLKHWASMRQTYIAIPDSLSLLDPILFHQPLDQHMELITNQDAGYGLVQCCEVGDDFWGHVYNMSGGPSCRVVFEDYIEHMFAIFGIRDFRNVMERNWFSLRNFHCGYYADADVLDRHLGHFRQSLEDHYKQVEEAMPWWAGPATAIAPNAIVKAFFRRWADPLRWIESDNRPYVDAFFGSREAWEKIPDWDRGSVR